MTEGRIALRSTSRTSRKLQTYIADVAVHLCGCLITKIIMRYDVTDNSGNERFKFISYRTDDVHIILLAYFIIIIRQNFQTSRHESSSIKKCSCCVVSWHYIYNSECLTKKRGFRIRIIILLFLKAHCSKTILSFTTKRTISIVNNLMLL